MREESDTDKPIIKVFINPLIAWIWIGVAIVVAGTFTALVPSVKPGAARVKVPEGAAAAPEVLHA